ncbi:MAG TPA: beta-ketoacyl synthase chain length factor [Rhodanobacteraceae bacterium]
MSASITLGIAGIGAWAPGATDWSQLAAILRGEAAYSDVPTARPAGACLPAAERRRAPDGVRLAAEVAAQAVAMAGLDAAALPCVFASTYGELAITDYVCTTLAAAPRDLSPTKFHNSVLNAPAGYWTIATHCTAPSSAVSAYTMSFAAGLLEAASLAASDATSTLFACCDVAATGPLAALIPTTRAFGAALVLTPDASTSTRLRIDLRPRDAPACATIEAPLPELTDANPASAHALALLSVLARRQAGELALPLSTRLALHIAVTP